MNVASLEGEPHGILCNALMPNGMSRMALHAAADWAQHGEGDSPGLPAEIGNSMDVIYNMPIAVYLASEACTETHGFYSQCLGRVARAFIGVVPGWQAQRQTPPSVEEIAGHWDEIRDITRGVDIPVTPGDELSIVLTRSMTG